MQNEDRYNSKNNVHFYFNFIGYSRVLHSNCSDSFIRKRLSYWGCHLVNQMKYYIIMYAVLSSQYQVHILFYYNIQWITTATTYEYMRAVPLCTATSTDVHLISAPMRVLINFTRIYYSNNSIHKRITRLYFFIMINITYIRIIAHRNPRQ